MLAKHIKSLIYLVHAVLLSDDIAGMWDHGVTRGRTPGGGLEYQANLLSLLALDPAVTHIVHNK